MKVVVFIACLAFSHFAEAEWKVPQNPNPRLILNEARQDCRNGQYDDALKKHLWFHAHALDVDRSYYGVRLSGALSSWLELGKIYPPAMRELKATRDATADKILLNKNVSRDAFRDVVAIDKLLGNDIETVNLFMRLNKSMPKRARQVYDMAQPALVKHEKFELCGEYLEPKEAFDSMVARLKNELEYARQSQTASDRQELSKLGDRKFTYDSAMLVFLLTKNRRNDKALKFANKAKQILNNGDHNSTINAAIEGKVPVLRNE